MTPAQSRELIEAAAGRGMRGPQAPSFETMYGQQVTYTTYADGRIGGSALQEFTEGIIKSLEALPGKNTLVWRSYPYEEFSAETNKYYAYARFVVLDEDGRPVDFALPGKAA